MFDFDICYCTFLEILQFYCVNDKPDIIIDTFIDGDKFQA